MSSNSSAIRPGSDLLNPAALRIPTAARHTEQRKPRTNDVRIGKPKADDWASVHPKEAFRWENFWAYEKDKSVYLLPPPLYDQLEPNVQRVFAESDFYLTAVLHADPIVWMLKHSDTDWFRSHRESVEAAMSGWVQVQSNRAAGRYDHKRATATWPDPDWSGYESAEDAQKLFTTLFSERLIAVLDHPVLERIRGRK
jgi:hypothetical protein